MTVQAYQTAFHRGDGPVKIRPIKLPYSEIVERVGGHPTAFMLLDEAFHWGQNDHQPVPGCYSVSVGDVIQLPNDRRFRVMSAGFQELESSAAPWDLVGTAARDAGRN